MTAAVCLIFFLSGAAALLFETLWFRQAGLVFGNSVWASSLVLASFMAGLALGNALAGALRRRACAARCASTRCSRLAIGAAGSRWCWCCRRSAPSLAPLLRPLARPAAGR